jgi:hypothetical protein
MKRAALGISMLATVLLLAVVPSQAWGHGWHGHGWRGHGGHGWHARGWHGHGYYSPRISIGLGPAFGWGPGPVWYGPPPAWAYPPRVIVAEPPVYIERQPATSLPSSYWYYCESAGGYYPSVPTCPEPWLKVPPRSE